MPRRRTADCGYAGGMAMSASDPFEIEVFRHLFASVAEEMGVTVQRSAHSPNIKERRDHSCAVFDHEGQMVAQAAHVPVHLGAMPMAVLAATDFYDEAPPTPGDLIIVNDPYLGGTHLPDITTVSPVFVGEPLEMWGWVATRAHHAATRLGTIWRMKTTPGCRSPRSVFFRT